MEGGIKPDASMKRPATGPAGGHRVRALSPEDADDAAALIRAAFAAQPAPTDPPPSALRDTADSVRARLVAGGGFGAEARGGGGLVGVVLWASRTAACTWGGSRSRPRGAGAAWRALWSAPPKRRRGRGACPGCCSARGSSSPKTGASSPGSASAKRRWRRTPGYDAPTSVRMEKTLPPGGVG
jgi:hypothetical protein